MAFCQQQWQLFAWMLVENEVQKWAELEYLLLSNLNEFKGAQFMFIQLLYN